MAQKLRKHEKNWKKTSVGCDIDFTILLSMLKVKEHLNLLAVLDLPIVPISHILQFIWSTRSENGLVCYVIKPQSQNSY